MAQPTLNELTAFMAVATHRSFRRAADELSMAPSTLSHAMRALEERMGVRLLNRTTRSVSPTQAGFHLLNNLQPALKSLDEALEGVAAFRGNVSGTVRVNAPRLAASILIRDVLPLMSQRFPDVTVDLVIEGQLVDIVARGFDAGVRLVDSIPRDMIAVPLLKAVQFICVASPQYLERYGVPGAPDELANHHCIGHRFPSGKLYKWEFERSGRQLVIDPPGRLILDDDELMVDAAANGLGIAYVGAPAAEAALAVGRLTRIFSDWTPGPEDIAIYYPGHRAVPPALRSFLDVVKDIQP
jgi:DNA-binding transcriptional LysR family regulator